jgi:hypothetical protein
MYECNHIEDTSQVSQRPAPSCVDAGLLETGLDEKELAVRVLYRLAKLSKNPPGGEANKKREAYENHLGIALNAASIVFGSASGATS